MEEYFDNQLLSSIVVFLSQVAFIYLRTLNVIFTVERRIWPSVLTGVGIGTVTLVSFAIGVKHFLDGNIIPVILFLTGGAVGTYWGIKQSIKKDNKKNS
jgi:hypothetical protein